MLLSGNSASVLWLGTVSAVVPTKTSSEELLSSWRTTESFGSCVWSWLSVRYLNLFCRAGSAPLLGMQTMGILGSDYAKAASYGSVHGCAKWATPLMAATTYSRISLYT